MIVTVLLFELREPLLCSWELWTLSSELRMFASKCSTSQESAWFPDSVMRRKENNTAQEKSTVALNLNCSWSLWRASSADPASLHRFDDVFQWNCCLSLSITYIHYKTKATLVHLSMECTRNKSFDCLLYSIEFTSKLIILVVLQCMYEWSWSYYLV